MSISVLILTLNEDVNLEACLASVAWSDDIVVLDSYSSDRTLEIARAAGARIYQRHFDNERNQRTFGLHEDFLQASLGLHAGCGRNYTSRDAR